jgi:Glycosyltransferase family 87
MPEWIRRLAQSLKSGEVFGRERIRAYCRILLAAEVAGFLFMVAGSQGLIIPLSKPLTSDFVSFYAAGSLAAAGTPERAYDESAHYAAEERATEPDIRYVYFYYPPVFLILCDALAHLPYLAAFGLFASLTLFAYLLVTRRILEEKGAGAFLPLLAFPAVWWALGIGQNSFLTAALFGGATLLLERRPTLAGCLFGALCYKPQFGLLIPVALAAGGEWRAFAGAALSCAALALFSLALFGPASWQAFFAALAGAQATYGNAHAVDPAAFVNPFGAILLVGGGVRLAHAIQGLAMLAAAALVALVWRRRARLPLRAATLLSAALVAAPVALFYDLVLGVVAAAWLVRDSAEAGFPAGERTALAALFPLPLLSLVVGERWHLPLSALAALALCALAARHALAHALAPPPKEALPALVLTPLPRR